MAGIAVVVGADTETVVDTVVAGNLLFAGVDTVAVADNQIFELHVGLHQVERHICSRTELRLH